MSSDHSHAPLTFDEAIELSMELVDFERSTHFPDHSQFHLERVKMLAERLDRVDKAVPTVHVTGTKGKGSTCALITSILTSAGFKVGFYSSPHLHSLCERVRVGLEPISKNDFAAIIPEIWPHGRSGWRKRRLWWRYVLRDDDRTRPRTLPKRGCRLTGA